MINLFVDDVRVCPYVGWVTARTIADAKRYLAAGKVVEMTLDHDMGACEACVAAHKDVGDMLTPETTFVSWCPHAEDGSALVRWMIETGHWSLVKPTVHSANPVGAARMRGLIDRYWVEHESS